MKISIGCIVIFLLVFFVACGPSDEEKARVKLEHAKILLQKNDTTLAIQQLDSISILYPKAMYSINAAKNLRQSIRLELMDRKEIELDSLKVQLANLEKNFVKEKTAFDRYAQYTHKRQTFKRAWNRSYVQIHLNDQGELYLSSNYHGKGWIKHTSLRVYEGDNDAKTEEIPLSNVDNHQSDFMDAKWEKVSYRKGKDNGVIKFIAKNTNRRLKAVFLGGKQHYIILESYDKEAVRDAFALSEAIKKKKQLENDIKALNK